MDSARSNLFWQGPGDKKRYHMVKWDHLAKPKEFGGLGFTDTRVMNVCLLSKWIVKLERGDNDPCTFLRNKYLSDRSFFSSDGSGGSQFWKGLHLIKKYTSQGLVYVLGNRRIRFWLDVWLDYCPLKIRFHRLFKICNQQDALVHKVLRNNEVNLTFRRVLGQREIEEWGELLRVLEFS
uniref:Reverse transcriptase zinc-binding domain-containing protein n=1 Tax=Arundo donax TaxID=35708 RepID=A0A0A9D099_ARUDO